METPDDTRHRRRPRLTRCTQQELDTAKNEQGTGFTRRDLRGLTLKDANVAGVDFRGSDFSDGSLRNAILTGARLSDCVFARTSLHGASLTGADLRGADLTRANGLTQDQLRGTLLAGAKLPANLFNFDGLDRVRDLVNRAERTLYVLLFTCASVAVICFSTNDEQLFQSSTSLKLPGLELPVPLSAFYQIAPLVLLAFYLWLSFTLRKLWAELANLPAEFHNHRWLHQQAAASTPNFVFMVCPWLRRADCKIRGTLPDRLLMVLGVWWVTPVTLWLIMASYLPRHEVRPTLIHAAILVSTTVAAMLFSRSMNGVLADTFAHLRPPPAPLADVTSTRAERHGRSQRRIASMPAVWAPSSPRAPGGIHGYAAEAPPPSATRDSAPPRTDDGWIVAAKRFAPSRTRLARICVLVGCALSVWAGYDAYSAIGRDGCHTLLARSGETPLKRLPNYVVGPACARQAARLGDASLTSVQLPHGNLRRAFLHSADLAFANLHRADLRYANLTEARLTGAELQDAELAFAVLWEARLDSARLKEAEMPRADLRGANLAHAEAQGVDWRGADLRGVDWSNALVCGADLRGAKVDWYRLHQANGWRRTLRDKNARDTLFQRRDSLAAGNDSVPIYLGERDAVEFIRWRRAWRAVRGLPADNLRPGDRINQRALREFVDTIDVSMGSARQREQVNLLHMIRTAPTAPTGSIAYTRELDDALRDFREEIRKKARNHCHDEATDALLPPERTPAPRKS